MAVGPDGWVEVNNKLIGSNRRGGMEYNGYLFEVKENEEFSTILDFNGPLGKLKSLIQLSDSSYYGIFVFYDKATIFRMSKYGTDQELLTSQTGAGPMTVNKNHELLITGDEFLFKRNTKTDVMTVVTNSNNYPDSLKFLAASDDNFYGVYDAPGREGTNKIFKVDRQNVESVFLESPLAGYRMAGNCLEGPDASLYGLMHNPDDPLKKDLMFKASMQGGNFQVVHEFSSEASEIIPYRWIQGEEQEVYGFAIRNSTLIFQKLSFSGAYEEIGEYPISEGSLSGNIEFFDGKLWGSFINPTAIFTYDVTTHTVDILEGDTMSTGSVMLTSVPHFRDVDDEDDGDDEEIVGNEEGHTDAISIYPNPTHDFLSVSGSLKSSRIEIQTSLGQTLPIEVFDKTVDVRSLPVGIYLLRIHTANRSTVFKFVKR